MLKLKCKKNNTEWESPGDLDINSPVNEIVVYNDDECSQEFASDFFVYIENKQIWVDYNKAISDHDLIYDNYNTKVFEPKNEEDRKRGYTL